MAPREFVRQHAALTQSIALDLRRADEREPALLDVVERLEEQGIIARYLPETDLTRISVGCWNDRSDVDGLAAALRG